MPLVPSQGIRENMRFDISAPKRLIESILKIGLVSVSPSESGVHKLRMHKLKGILCALRLQT